MENTLASPLPSGSLAAPSALRLALRMAFSHSRSLSSILTTLRARSCSKTLARTLAGDSAASVSRSMNTWCMYLQGHSLVSRDSSSMEVSDSVDGG